MPTLGPEIERLIEGQRLCSVATVNEDGTPNLSPKGTMAVLDGEHLVFGDIRSPQTIKNLRARPAVEVNVIDPFSRKGYRFRGTATIHEDGPNLDALMAILAARATTNPINLAVVIRVEHAAPVLSPAYDQGSTEAELRALWIARQTSFDS